MKVSQFGPALLAAWELASRGALRVPCGEGELGRKKAVHLRHRLYQLRTAMGKEDHPQYQNALRAKLVISTERKQHILRGLTPDSDLEDILAGAGVEVPEAPEAPEFDENEEDELDV